MATASLHDDGWRQGSLIRATLKAYVIDHDGQQTVAEVEHDLWMLANQDCDLAWTKPTDANKRFELRPLYRINKNDKVDGIRSKVAKVTDDLVLHADSPRLMLTARALTALREKREDLADEAHRREIKTWLGLRYDRPAVPTECEATAKALLAELDIRDAGFERKIRDALVYYYENPKHVNLFVVVRDKADSGEISDWLDVKIAELSDSHGIVVKARYVNDSDGTPLSVIETYYGLFSDELSLTAEFP